MPGSVLAYAETGTTERARPALFAAVPFPVARPGSLRSVGLRAAAHDAHRQLGGSTVVPASIVATAPRLTGLRKAARLMNGKAAL